MSVDSDEEDEVSKNAKEGDAKLGDLQGKKKNVEEDEDDDDDKGGEASSSNIEEGGSIPEDLKEHEKKALADLRWKVEEAILSNEFRDVKKAAPHKSHKHDGHDHHHHHHHHHHHEAGHDGGKGKAKEVGEVDKDITLWGVPLLPSKGNKWTDVLLMKFLRAKDFKAGEAYEMLKSSLDWREENMMDSIMLEDFGNEYDSVSYMKGLDREGHPVCYNVYGVFANEDIYNRTFGTQKGRDRFLRWRLQLLEREIEKLDFTPGGISTLLQVNDLKDTPGPSRRDLRHATKQAVTILQDNYPEFVARNIFINVPFWYYAFNALLSPFLTQTTKSKFVFSRPARVTETLVKYIAAEQIPIAHGGLLREDDREFSTKDVASEIAVKAGATETIEIPAREIGCRLVWDLTIIGWDVNYKEEFVPLDASSYTMIVKKQRKISSWQEEPIRNSFKNKEAGKLVITIENGMFKKKRVLYRFKINKPDPSSSSSSTSTSSS